MQTTFTCFTYSCLLNRLYNNINYFLSKFQIFTIYSAAAIIILLSAVGQFSNYGQFGGHVRGVTIGVLIYTITIFALANAIGYYLWDIVKSAYKQIKEENENIHPAGNYMMNTYGKSEPPQYNHHV